MVSESTTRLLSKLSSSNPENTMLMGVSKHTTWSGMRSPWLMTRTLGTADGGMPIGGGGTRANAPARRGGLEVT